MLRRINVPLHLIHCCAFAIGVLLCLQYHRAAADDPAPSADQAEASFTRTPEQLALEKQYADEQRTAALAFFACVEKARDAGFLGVGAQDPRVVCISERAQYARYLPEDQAAPILDQTAATILNGEAE